MRGKKKEGSFGHRYGERMRVGMATATAGSGCWGGGFIKRGRERKLHGGGEQLLAYNSIRERWNSGARHPDSFCGLGDTLSVLEGKKKNQSIKALP